MRRSLIILLFSFFSLPAAAVPADESFLEYFAGNWRGDGMVLTKIGGTKVNVTCNLKSDASATTLSMNGTCRGLVVITRTFSANVKGSERGYSGDYIGPSGQPSKLVGSRDGNAINFDVTWLRVINGDKSANMMIEKVGDDGLRLQTVDQDLETGKPVVTSRIDLKRQ